jgi:hypothetical protein
MNKNEYAKENAKKVPENNGHNLLAVLERFCPFFLDVPIFLCTFASEIQKRNRYQT